jgi:hypothetical protein
MSLTFYTRLFVQNFGAKNYNAVICNLGLKFWHQNFAQKMCAYNVDEIDYRRSNILYFEKFNELVEFKTGMFNIFHMGSKN